MRTRRLAPRAGFTLMELLIACGLTGLVMALAMNGFTSLNKMTSLSQSRLQGRQMGAEALPRLAALMRGANIFFYTGRPLANVDLSSAANVRMGANPNGSQDPATQNVPQTLRRIANPGRTRYDFLTTDSTNYPGATTDEFDIARFRFIERSGGATGTSGGFFLQGLGDTALRVCQYRRVPGTTPVAYHANYFPSPLAYFAVANLSNHVDTPGAGTGDNKVAGLPMSWNIYVLYLAPMNLGRTDANLAYNDANSRDLFPPRPGFLTPALRGRNRMPLQLRLLTIPGVHATNPAATVPTIPGPGGTNIPLGRVYAPGSTSEILEPPFDYVTPNGPNYDPLPIPMAQNATGFLSSNYSYVSGASVLTRAASGPRVADAAANLHANFNQLGNDPPTERALTRLIPGAAAATDKVLVDYIDPDNTNGTSVRFLNNIEESTQGAAAGTYMRYVNTIGTIQDDAQRNIGSDYMYNHYYGRTSQAAKVNKDGPHAAPRRLLLSVTTRYRTTRQVPFQFSTVSTEVDLEGLSNYSKLRPPRL